MPTILIVFGWRLYFYSNERNEPPHIHCQKGDMECKYWLDETNFDIWEAYSYNISPRDRREIRKIIFNNFEDIIREWYKFKNKK